MKSSRIVHISSLPPTPCGVAEYTAALAAAMRDNGSDSSAFLVRLDCDAAETLRDGGAITINPSDRKAIDVAAACVNSLERKVVLLQHEFKLYGMPAGENVVWLLESLKAPVVTTLHTVWPCFPSPVRQQIFMEVLRRSTRLVVFSEVAADILRVNFGVSGDKVKVVPHGVPDVPFRRPTEVKLPGVPPRSVRFITSGLLRPAKGIEHALAAFAEVKSACPDFAYVICGADHPRDATAREYREKLLEAVTRYGLGEHVFFLDRFVEWPDLVDAIQACDAGLLPYTSPGQSSSGVLALTLACGRPVVAADFQHARATVNQDTGIVVPMGNVEALAFAIKELALDPSRRARMAEASYSSTRSWTWREVARRHAEIVAEAEL